VTSTFPGYTPHVTAKPKTLSRQKVVKVQGEGIDDKAREGYGSDIEVSQEKRNINVTDANKSTDDVEKRPPSKPDSCWAHKEYSACHKIKLITALIGTRHWNVS
jgi:hypothetical protein